MFRPPDSILITFNLVLRPRSMKSYPTCEKRPADSRVLLHAHIGMFRVSKSQSGLIQRRVAELSAGFEATGLITVRSMNLSSAEERPQDSSYKVYSSRCGSRCLTIRLASRICIPKTITAESLQAHP